MSSIRKLIENQTIRIDDHKWGAQEEKNWDLNNIDIHIDKTTNNYRTYGKRQDVRIKIPINSEGEISISNNKKGEIPKKLEEEIRKALNNRTTRNHFIKDIAEVLKNYKTILTDEKRISDVMARLSKHFDLRWTGEKISRYTNEILISYTQVYTDNKKEYFVKADLEKIEIGENSGYAKSSKKINR